MWHEVAPSLCNSTTSGYTVVPPMSGEVSVECTGVVEAGGYKGWWM